VGRGIEVLHLVHSLDPKTGGVLSAVERLNESLNQAGAESRISDDPQCLSTNENQWIIAHGLWQWPGRRARQLGNPYLVYPHGMLDPWFKKTYPFKHIKKQLYWWTTQFKILRGARAVCFTTIEEELLGKNTFFPNHFRAVVTGLGVGSPPGDEEDQIRKFLQRFPQARNRKILIYLGRFHPKKGVDDLLHSWKNRQAKDKELLLLAGPLEEKSSWINYLQSLSDGDGSILWSGMLEGDEKWGALRTANAMILPSHQENYGMVVAEACSVGLPVYLTDKVNLWREIVDAGAGEAQADGLSGVQTLVNSWQSMEGTGYRLAALKCFEERMHVRCTSQNLLGLMGEKRL